VNDVGVPVPSLAPFLREAEAIFARFGLPAAIYGHAGSGNLHLRPAFDRADPDLAGTVARVADAIYGLVVSLDGTVTAEHGMLLRAPWLRLSGEPPRRPHARGEGPVRSPRGSSTPAPSSRRGVAERMART
jgi:FAD/FMN-containing dehydrogenase